MSMVRSAVSPAPVNEDAARAACMTFADRANADPVAAAIETAAEDGRLVLIDFDHTLFASNSTELFLASARPAFMVSLLLGLVRGVFPWHLYSRYFHRLRDYLTVLAVIALMPWTLVRWRRHGPPLFRRHTTHKLARGLSLIPAERVVIVSFGITALIRPLLRGSPWESCRIVSMDIPCRPHDLVAGKAALLRKAMPGTAAGAAMFITDSEDDRDLLDAVATPCLVPPQGAKQGLRMKDAGEDLLHVSIVPRSHFPPPLQASL